MNYRVVRSLHYTPASFALARTYARLEDAVSDMGDGIVLDETERLVAFHERHWRFVQHASREAVREPVEEIEAGPAR